ncbi:hypothetical protein [Ralstonia sp. A12]|uniref:hypothetical protein n=1 Tax=Ralstonia sp. A12 TaxID=1217052 RepID=UPI0012ED7043|nr:hypothetical protein [Ralstonia sp. A12]
MIEDFRRGKVDLDCKRMVLSQNKEGGERYEGKGYIRQAEDDVLVYKLYITKVENATPHNYVATMLNHQLGTLHGDEMHYNLTAETYDGTTVSATRIYPNVSWGASAGAAEIAIGKLQSLTAKIEFPEVHHCLELYFFEEHEVPLHEMSEAEEHGQKCWTLDTTKFEACGAKFTVKVRKGSGLTAFEATSASALHSSFHLRVQEALQYMTGKSATYRARVTCSPGLQMLELVSPGQASLRPHFCPPIALAAWEYRTHGWKLFSAYLAYVLKNTQDTYWNPLAYHLHNARESSANSIDAWAIGVSVALEAVASLVALKADPDNEKKVAAFQQLMFDYIATLLGYEGVAQRMEGLIKGLSASRPQDALHALAHDGFITKKYVAAWGQLRNRHVHPKIKDLNKPDQKQQQKMIDRIHCVHVLLAQLTFHLIGYDGPYTDYGAKGFPQETYPLPAPAHGSSPE